MRSAIISMAILFPAIQAFADTTHIYRGPIGGGTAELVVSQTMGGAIGKLSVIGNRCAGNLAGVVTETPGLLAIARPPDPIDKNGESCVVIFNKVGSSLSNNESNGETHGCTMWHGQACDFGGANLRMVR